MVLALVLGLASMGPAGAESPGAAAPSQTDAHALWLGKQVLAIAEVLRDPQGPEAMAAVVALGHDSRYYLMVRGWLRMQLEADTSILQASGGDASPRIVQRVAFLRKAIRAVDLE
jgi:hypothetical protein